MQLKNLLTAATRFQQPGVIRIALFNNGQFLEDFKIE
jgi:hypothetical protein